MGERSNELTWDDFDEVWVRPVTLSYFRGMGRNLEPEAPPTALDPPVASPTPGQQRARAELDAEVARMEPGARGFFQALLGAAGFGSAGTAEPEREPGASVDAAAQAPLQVDTGGRRKAPSAAQQAAVEEVLGRDEAFWEGVMAALLEVYRAQQPLRARWWRAVYGEHQLQRALPEIADVSGLRDLVRLASIRILPGGKKVADIEVAIAATWNQDPIEILLRGGEVVRIQAGVPLPAPEDGRKQLIHPLLGPLGRPDDHAPWTGYFHCPAFREYLALIAEQRASFRRDPAGHGPPQSVMPWDFLLGRFELRVYTSAGEPPAEAQAAAVTRFLAQEGENVDRIVGAIYEHYREIYEVARREYLDRYREENVPPPTGSELLHERLQLYRVNVFPPDADGRARLGFMFVALWYPGPDLALRWCDGKVEAIGGREVGQPPSA